MDDQLKNFYEADQLLEADWDVFRSLLQEIYTFEIQNPDWTENYGYSMWVRNDGYEYPILTSASLGQATFLTRETEVGNSIEPTPEFLSLVGYGFHEACSFTPHVYFSDRFEETVDRAYDGKPRAYEVWAASQIISRLFRKDDYIPELEPLAQWADKHTEFECPFLGGDPDE